MSATRNDEVREYVDDRLDGRYVAATGRAIAEALLAGTTIEANYQPGDGTSYRLVFAPLTALAVAPGRVTVHLGNPNPTQWEDRCPFGVSRTRGACLVSWVDHGAVALDLETPGSYVGSYVAGKFGGVGVASGFALAALFDAVGDAMGDLG